MSINKAKENDIHHLPLNCLIDKPIPDPHKKKNQTQAEKEHVAHYHTKYGGSLTLVWFTRLNLPPAVQKLMCYPESCVLVNEFGASVGKMYSSITMNEWASKKCLLIHSGSYAKLRHGLEVGTDITGFITQDFRIIQELGHEWARIDGVMYDRKTFLMNEPDGKLYCKIIFKRDDEIKQEKVTLIPFTELTTFVSEASNILLQRLIIQQKKLGEIDLKCLTSNGKVVKCNYRILGNGYENIKGEEVKVWGIRRSVFTKAGVYCWDSLFNYYGRLVLRCQPENNFAMIPLWFKPAEEFDQFGTFIGILPPLVWGCDPKLYADYSVRKTELTAEYKKYLIEHPDLRSILSDFLQKILLQRPRNIVEFAKTYFQPFVFFKQEETPKSSETNSPNLSSQMSMTIPGEDGEYGGEGNPRGVSFAFSLGGLEDYLLQNQNDDDDFPTDEILEPRHLSPNSGSVTELPDDKSKEQKQDVEVEVENTAQDDNLGLLDALNDFDT